MRHLGFKRLEAVLHRRQVVALPHAAHPGWRNRQALPLQRLRDSDLAPGGLFNRHRDHRLLDFWRRAVLQHRLAAADLLQRQLTALVVEFLEPIEAIATVAIILQAWLTLPSCLAS